MQKKKINLDKENSQRSKNRFKFPIKEKSFVKIDGRVTVGLKQQQKHPKNKQQKAQRIKYYNI